MRGSEVGVNPSLAFYTGLESSMADTLRFSGATSNGGQAVTPLYQPYRRPVTDADRNGISIAPRDTVSAEGPIRDAFGAFCNGQHCVRI